MARPVVLVGGHKIIPHREDLEQAPWGRFAAGKPGRRKGEKLTAVPSFFNIPDDAPFIGAPAIEWENSHFGDSGGFCGPRYDEGYGGRTYRVQLSFWVRFNKYINHTIETHIFQITRHDSLLPYAGVSVRYFAGSNGSLIASFTRVDPWLSGGGITSPASNFPTFQTSDGQVVLGKWHWIIAELGSTLRVMVLPEDATEKGTWFSISGNQIADEAVPYNWRGAIGTAIPSSTNSADLDIPRMDFCNFRVGYAVSYPDQWWAANYWKRPIDISAERLTCQETLSFDSARRCACYGYPFQEDYLDEGGQGPEFTPYSGSIISGTGPKLLPAYGS